jgi:hypothetical protein
MSAVQRRLARLNALKSRPDVPGAQEGARRPWWRRVFGG